MLDRRGVLTVLSNLGIEIREHAHPPVFTCDEAQRLVVGVSGAPAKNLFLRDRKGRRHLLLVIRPEQNIDLGALSESLEMRGLSFASPQRLARYLGVEPGSVSVLALLNDTTHAVELVMDEVLSRSDEFQCHPLVNTHTLSLRRTELERVLTYTGHTLRAMSLLERCRSDHHKPA